MAGISTTKSNKEMAKALDKAFERIKEDMTSLKEGQHQHGVRISEVSQTLKDAKADLVTVDKFNILKIKIGELNESMKKVWDNEKKLEDLDKRSVGVDDFDKQSVVWNNEIKKLQSDLDSLDKDSATEDQIKGLASEVNDELKKVRKAIEELRNIKDSITKSELERRTKQLNARADTSAKQIKELKKAQKSLAGVDQVQAVVDDVNSEFDTIRKSVADLSGEVKKTTMKKADADARFKDVDVHIKDVEKDVDKQLRSVEKEMDRGFSDVDSRMEKGFHDVDSRMYKLDLHIEDTRKRLIKGLDRYSKGIESAVDDLADRASAKMDMIRSDLADFQRSAGKEHKTFMTKNQGHNLVEDINKEFDHAKKDINSVRDDLKKARKDFSSKDDLAAAFTGLGNSIRQLQEDMDGRLDELRKKIRLETDRLDQAAKSNTKDLTQFKKDMKTDRKLLVENSQFEAELDAIQDEFEVMHENLSKFQEKMLTKNDGEGLSKDLRRHDHENKQDYAQKVHFEKLAETVDKLEQVLGMQKLDLKEKKKEIRAKNKELKVYAKELKAHKKSLREVTPGAVYKEPYRKTRIFGNIFIGLAFTLVILAIIFWFTGLDSLTTGLSIASVLSFILGITLKIIVAVKTGDHDPKMANQIVSVHNTPAVKKSGKVSKRPISKKVSKKRVARKKSTKKKVVRKKPVRKKTKKKVKHRR